MQDNTINYMYVTSPSHVLVHNMHAQQPTVTSLLQLQHRSSVFRNLPSSDNPTAVRDSSSESSSDVCNYGPLGLVDCSLENLEGLERISEQYTLLAHGLTMYSCYVS